MAAGWSRVPAARRVLAFAFLLYGAVAVPSLALLTPPFQVADEEAHFERAAAIAGGGLVGTRYPAASTAGGRIDRAIFLVEQMFVPIKGHPERKVSRATLEAAARVPPLGTADASFPNTALYPPLLYLPAAAAIAAAREAALSVPRTLVLARLAMGFTCVALGTLAILAAGDAAATVLFAILALPMTLSLFASVSQDGPLIALSALAVAMLLRADGGPGARPSPRSSRALGVACAALGLAAMAKPAYLPLGLALLAPRGPTLRGRALGLSLVVAATFGWILVVEHFTFMPQISARAGAQTRFVLSHPAILWTLAAHAAAELAQGPIARQFVGVLGWLDTPLSSPLYGAAFAMLAASVAAACLAGRPRGAAASFAGVPGFLLVLGGIAASIVAVYLVQYLTWTPLGADTVVGPTGRYLTPALLFVPLLLPALDRASALRRGLVACVLALPALSIPVTLRAIVLRYYR